jgi:anti-sigma factor RsiW
MNCRDIESLLSAERDGMLTSAQRSSLESHVASCRACAELRTKLSQAMDAFRSEAAAVPIPDVDEEWQKVCTSLTDSKTRSRDKRPLTPILWFATPLAAAAALAFAFFSSSPMVQPTGESMTTMSEAAQAEYVEPGDAKASTIVYVDKDSGWLVVWATDSDADPKI